MDVEDALERMGWPRSCEHDELEPNWHRDRHWRVVDPSGTVASLRAVSIGRPARWEERRAQHVGVVAAQARAAEALRDEGIPFMPLLRGPLVSDGFVVVLFGWVRGRPCVRPDPARAAAVGALTRRLHRAGSRVHGPAELPRHDVAAMARRSLDELAEVASGEFIARANAALEAVTDPRAAIVVHGDLNLPNVLWRHRSLSGLVDFDQIGIGDPVEELAWVVKWWSRPDGVGDRGNRADLARAVLDAYRPTATERARLPPLLWLTACLNANSALAMRGLRGEARARLEDRLLTRADALASLAR